MMQVHSHDHIMFSTPNLEGKRRRKSKLSSSGSHICLFNYVQHTDVHMWSCDMFAENYGHLVPCDIPSSGEVYYERYVPAIAMDQV